MGIFSSSFTLPSKQYGNGLLNAIIQSATLMFSKKYNKKAHYEALLLASLYFLRIMKDRKPLVYNNIEKEYFTQLYAYTVDSGIISSLNVGFSNFVNSRFEFYGKQLDSYRSNSSFLFTKVSYLLNISPLSDSLQNDLNPLNYSLVNVGIKHMTSAIDDAFNIFIKDNY